MPTFRTGIVSELLLTRTGLQRVTVTIAGDAPTSAYALTDLVGPLAVGDAVILNTTAVELELGTGGWHVVHWNLSRNEWHADGGGHIMKARYTSVQFDAGATEEHEQNLLAQCTTIDGMPVVLCALHSQIAGVAASIKQLRSNARIAYIMSDGGALPLVISDLVHHITQIGWLDVSITAGNAFGGDYEAVTLHSALTIARHVALADVAIVAPGPGIVGTNTALGTTSVELGVQLDAVNSLGGDPIVTLRASNADQRVRHRGISHHLVTALTTVAHTRATVAFPSGAVIDDVTRSLMEIALRQAKITELHSVVDVQVSDIVACFEEHGIVVESMGRTAASDRILFDCAAAAGVLAARRISGSDGP